MRYLRAYLRAWMVLFVIASVLLFIRCSFVGFEPWTAGYLFYLVTTSAVGGVVGEWIKR